MDMDNFVRLVETTPAWIWLVFAIAIGVVVFKKRHKVIRGVARVIDGDGLVVDGREIRIAGIDAPEMRQIMYKSGGGGAPIGKMARSHLIKLVGRGEVSCRVLGVDKYGRVLAVCYNSNGLELGRAMVKAGMAQSYGYRTRRQANKYRFAQLYARVMRRGVWAKGTNWKPEKFRAQGR